MFKLNSWYYINNTVFKVVDKVSKGNKKLFEVTIEELETIKTEDVIIKKVKKKHASNLNTMYMLL